MRRGASTCCSRTCVDIGGGVPVCQFASGCRLTGESCTKNDECCGGGSHPNGTVVCQGAPNGRCDNGQACNPVGNICGAPVLPNGESINASQNCCDGRKEVCQLDSAGIPRCMGGCPDGNCDPACAAGYNGEDCCIENNALCELSDQCCDDALCIPAADDQLRCTVLSGCQPIGGICTPDASPDSPEACCSGTVCQLSADNTTSACVSSQNPSDPGSGSEPDAGVGGSDAGSETDAGGNSDAGTGDPSCTANGNSCGSGSECCSGICTDTSCAPGQACQPFEAACTADGDCCVGLKCAIDPGQVSGQCLRSASTCSAAGQSCNTEACCSGLDCLTRTALSCDGTELCTCRSLL